MSKSFGWVHYKMSNVALTLNLTFKSGRWAGVTLPISNVVSSWHPTLNFLGAGVGAHHPHWPKCHLNPSFRFLVSSSTKDVGWGGYRSMEDVHPWRSWWLYVLSEKCKFCSLPTNCISTTVADTAVLEILKGLQFNKIHDKCSWQMFFSEYPKRYLCFCSSSSDHSRKS